MRLDTRGRPPDPDEPVAALELDRYLDALLAARDQTLDRRRGTGPGRPAGPSPIVEADPSRLAADRLAELLVRVHPSFRFEERLARRLVDLAATVGPVRPPGDERLVPEAMPQVPLAPEPQLLLAPEGPVGVGPIGPTSPTTPVRSGRLPLAAAPLRNPVVIGGAITSAALSIAGVALVAWRRSRPRRPARAVSLAHADFGAVVLGDRSPRVGRRRGRSPALLAGLALRAAARPGTGGASVQGRT